MKNNFFKLIWLFVAAIFVVSCEEDESSLPKLNLSADAVEIAENATSPLIVKIQSDKALGVDYTANITISGTAAADVHYQAIATTVTIPANETEAKIFINPINIPAVESDQTLTLTLGLGETYELGDNVTLELTIKDNKVVPSDAPTIAFTGDDIVINPYLEEDTTIKFALNKPLSADVEVLFSFAGQLTEGVDYELVGLTENKGYILPAGTLSAEFKVQMKNTAVLDMNKKLTIGFVSTTDYAVNEAAEKRTLTAVDPQVDFSVWFNDDNKHTTFFGDWDASGLNYRTDIYAYKIKRYYKNTETGNWSTLSGGHKFITSEKDQNQWKEQTNIYRKLVGYSKIELPEQERYAIESGDFLGMIKYTDKEAKYSKNLMVSEGWLRFASVDPEATSGSVVIPMQTLTFYKMKNADEWNATLKNADETQSWKGWYEDSRLTQGDMSKSSKVTPVTIEIERSVGTYNLVSKEIIIKLKFKYSDPDITIDPKYATKEGDTYTMELRYINNK